MMNLAYISGIFGKLRLLSKSSLVIHTGEFSFVLILWILFPSLILLHVIRPGICLSSDRYF